LIHAAGLVLLGRRVGVKPFGVGTVAPLMFALEPAPARLQHAAGGS
jgi:hypothetical protein